MIRLWLAMVQHFVDLAVDTGTSLAIWVPATAVLAGTLVGGLMGLVGKRGETRVSADAQLIAGQLSYIGQVTKDNQDLRTELVAIRHEHAAEMAAIRREHATEVAQLRAELVAMRVEAETLRGRVGKVEKDVDGFS